MNVRQHPLWLFVLFPAVAMLLGWGLRGYIGGGPYAAMIPGVYVALALCLLLGYRKETAAIAAVFGAIGVGYGGDMTYGQTLGFLRESDTVLWGLLGCLVKGGVWGIFGGVTLGVGLARDRYSVKTLTVAFLLTIAAFYLGVKLINEPKLIYFSNRLDRPRDESWAGLLFAALTLLGYLRARGSAADFAIPMRFALWGTLGGGLGFAGGALWMVFGPDFPIEQKWIGWWKMMEFTFGFVFGAALGACAYQNRDMLRAAGQRGETPGTAWGPVAGLATLVAFIFCTYPFLDRLYPEADSGAGAWILRNALGLAFSYVVFGGIAILLGLRSRTAAWQAAITVTFFHTVLDYVRDLSDAEAFGYTLSVPMQIAVLLAATATVGFVAYRIQHGEDVVRRMFLWILVTCYIVACVRSFLRKEYLMPPDGETAWSLIVSQHASLIFVHGTFTVSAILTAVFIWTRFPRNGGETAPSVS